MKIGPCAVGTEGELESWLWVVSALVCLQCPWVNDVDSLHSFNV